MTVAVRYAFKIAYDGTKFSGSQRQPKVRTVDGECIFVLKKIGAIDGPREARYQSASRTDAGVSAAGNVIAFNTAMPQKALVGSFNSEVRDVWAWGVASVPDDFNARKARQRWYRYHLRANLEIQEARAAASLFEGRHDFRWFTRVKTDTVKTVDSIEVSRIGDFTCLDVRGQSFLWGLVRRIASCVEGHCLGEVSLRQIERALAGERSDFGLAPSEPLVLVDVDHGLEFENVSFGRIKEEVDERLGSSKLAAARWSLVAGRLGIGQAAKRPAIGG